MKEKYITLDYQEYLKELDKINKLEDLISKLYLATEDEKLKKEIEKYMIENNYWI